MAESIDVVDAGESSEKPKVKRSASVSQNDVPSVTLTEASRVAEVLRDEFAKAPTKPFNLAKALGIGPSGSQLRSLTGAAVAYGMIDGGAQATLISLTELGRRIVAPVEDGDDVIAKREAVLKPRVLCDFLRKYDGSPLPSYTTALNVIEEMGVPSSSVERAYRVIIRNAEELNLLVEIKSKKYVQLEGVKVSGASSGHESADIDVLNENNVIPYPGSVNSSHDISVSDLPESRVAAEANNRVFVSHGKNYAVVDQVKTILQFGKFEPVISVEQQTVAKPVPDKVMDDMRSCGAAIVHVGVERKLVDADGNEHTEINPNVLIEIGAAMALYRQRFVLLVERGVVLPSNLQGLCEVRYEGELLDHDATMKLLEAFNQFR